MASSEQRKLVSFPKAAGSVRRKQPDLSRWATQCGAGDPSSLAQGRKQGAERRVLTKALRDECFWVVEAGSHPGKKIVKQTTLPCIEPLPIAQQPRELGTAIILASQMGKLRLSG